LPSAAYALGNAQAELRAGDQAYEQGDFARAVRELEPAAEQGEMKAEIILGTIYWTGGKGVTRDDRKALAWFRRAADQPGSAVPPSKAMPTGNSVSAFPILSARA
jgi:TPR repeat protein